MKLSTSSLLLLFVSLSALFCTVRTGSTRICGTRLLKQVVHICGGCIAGTHVEEIEKRRGASTSNGFLMSRINAQSAKNLYSPDWHKNRGKRGIVEECCYNQCSYSALKKYCCPKKPVSNDTNRRLK